MTIFKFKRLHGSLEMFYRHRGIDFHSAFYTVSYDNSSENKNNNHMGLEQTQYMLSSDNLTEKETSDGTEVEIMTEKKVRKGKRNLTSKR